MSKLSLCLFAITTLYAASRAAPAHEHSKELSIELSEVLNKSVCPIHIEINEDKMRIPRRIKELKCAKTPNPICQKPNMTHACCHHRHHNFSTQCVEVHDQVLVKFLDQKTPTVISVAIGCNCMIRESTTASEENP